MIPLFASILSSTFIFVLFRLFPKYRIDTFQAIVFNYVTACSLGFILYGHDLKPAALEHADWFPFALLTGGLFISLFLLMGVSSQRNGVALTSVSVKMSMAMSVLLFMLAYHEPLSGLKITGMLLAVAGVLLMSLPSGKQSAVQKPLAWMLICLFIGSGILDFLLNYVQQYHQQHLPSSLFSAIGFGIAGLLGLGFLSVELLRQKRVFHWRNVVAGIVLGVPNYFSIYLLMLSYSTTGWSDSTVLAITNVAIVLLASLTGFLLFRENFHLRKLAGLTAAVLAILCLYFASTSSH
jgi:drug/metabolite transporter (DMT)-like permease